jgi:pimeloyl-ACP methyl ester carboxylesterase
MLARDYQSVFISASDGLRLHARDYGATYRSTLPVVCIPGLTRNSADFHELALNLSRDVKRPRRVLALDLRGRGLSEYDPDWTHYDPRTELGDVLQVLTATGIHQAVFVGTSRGGLITMGLSAARPALIFGAVLNDIGPVVDGKGLMRIRGYVGKMPQPANFAEAGAILKRLFDAQFPLFSTSDWENYAHNTWKDTPSGLMPDYDINLMKGLEQIDLETSLPTLWPLFEGLKNVPVMTLRGALSDILSDETVEDMRKRHPRFESIIVPSQGHAPLLNNASLIARISRFIARCET